MYSIHERPHKDWSTRMGACVGVSVSACACFIFVITNECLAVRKHRLMMHIHHC